MKSPKPQARMTYGTRSSGPGIGLRTGRSVTECGGTLRASSPPPPYNGDYCSAGWQPAVSRIANPRTARSAPWPADCQSAKLQIINLRHDPPRSADFQSAVPRISNPPAPRTLESNRQFNALPTGSRPACCDGGGAGRRHRRLETCAPGGHPSRRLLALGFLCSVLCLPALAQFAIPWHTLDGGGGTSTGGVFRVNGTTGQPDAGSPAHAGGYTLVGGFWALPADAAGHYAAEPPPRRVAINFPFHSPETASTATFLDWLADLGAPALRQMTYNDVHWNQVEPADGAFNYHGPDQVFSNPHGIYPLPTLYGILAGANDVWGLQVPWRACTNRPYAPDCGWRVARDAADTENYVTNTVARYRHVARYWEIANEMNGKTSRPLGLPVPDFAAFMYSNRVWIRAADPDAKVVLPGMLGTYGFPFANSTNWLGQLLAAGGAGSFDVANYHDYNSVSYTHLTLPTIYSV